jgi:serine/threonine protein kinase
LSTSKTESSDGRRIDDICLAALERDPSERAEFVRVACGGDAALLGEVEGLLAHAHTAEGFLGASIGAVAADVMSVGSGQSLVGRSFGSYQILAAIGAGGMGEVYRARDAKLGRDVAIKVLPAAFTADRDRLARFEREARVLASLNHPNIAAIYGLEQIGDVQALVLELVEGETLAERIGIRDSGFGISKGRATSDALAIARQIAEALEAAHEKGIVHRDLKPANVKVTPGGTVKVLDFGLAKSGAGSAPELSHSPTITISGTRDGVLLGTAA